MVLNNHFSASTIKQAIYFLSTAIDLLDMLKRYAIMLFARRDNYLTPVIYIYLLQFLFGLIGWRTCVKQNVNLDL